MSAVLSHMARDEGLELRLALMIVPSTDFRWLIAPEPVRSEIAERYPSTKLYKDAPWGGMKREQWFLDYWIPIGKSYAHCMLIIVLTLKQRSGRLHVWIGWRRLHWQSLSRTSRQHTSSQPNLTYVEMRRKDMPSC
jgi:hypothetical protein